VPNFCSFTASPHSLFYGAGHHETNMTKQFQVLKEDKPLGVKRIINATQLYLSTLDFVTSSVQNDYGLIALI